MLMEIRHSRTSNLGTMATEWVRDLDDDDLSMLFHVLEMPDQTNEDLLVPLGTDFSGTPKPVSKKASTQKAKRVRRREEISSLRQEVQELAQRLDLLRTCHQNTSTAQGASLTNWRMLAVREQQLREIKEAENARLRELLLAHLAVSEDLKRISMQRRARYASLSGL